MNNNKFHLTGLVAAPFTPFDANGALNLAMIPRLADHYAATGVSGAFVCGTTGEGSSMSNEERMIAAEAWRKATAGKLNLIVHVGHNSLVDSRALAAHAEKIGAEAVAAIAPCFFRPGSVSELVDWCAGIASAAPGTPFYYYHMPAMTGVNFAMVDFAPLAVKRIPNFGGIKFTHENIMDFSSALAAGEGGYDVLFGRDEILLSALVMGATGAVGSTYNYAAPIYNRVIKAYKAGDMAAARREQLKSIQFIEVFCKYGGMSANKVIMKLIGLDCGPVRQPLSQITSAQEAALKADLERIGFFEAVRVG
ncbi:dihydrodipicolinate synthase family protein [Termitidicoccus mucosus]|uniref:Dihydrodipicolinate synthetase n=1 Tax=Termitidicoccus mucosus TaxID=1184151 RepID=A0A178IGN4_9BACT|nr:dihydrodipicolinate synthetase [Opitutaceae bacterium TSB47]